METETETETPTAFELWLVVIRATYRICSLLSRRRSLGPRVRKDDDVFPFSFPAPVPPFSYSPPYSHPAEL